MQMELQGKSQVLGKFLDHNLMSENMFIEGMFFFLSFFNGNTKHKHS